MIALLNAIYAWFIADAGFATQFPGGLHRDRAPQGTAMPYAVSRVISSTSELAYGGTSRRRTQVRFAVYALGHDAAGQLAQLLVSRFDGALLTLASGINDSVLRLGDPTPALLNQDGMGNDVWEWAVVLDYTVVG